MPAQQVEHRPDARLAHEGHQDVDAVGRRDFRVELEADARLARGIRQQGGIEERRGRKRDVLGPAVGAEGGDGAEDVAGGGEGIGGIDALALGRQQPGHLTREPGADFRALAGIERRHAAADEGGQVEGDAIGGLLWMELSTLGSMLRVQRRQGLFEPFGDQLFVESAIQSRHRVARLAGWERKSSSPLAGCETDGS